MPVKIAPEKLRYERRKSWKYEVVETTVLDFSHTSHRLLVMDGCVELRSRYRDFCMATIQQTKLTLYEGMTFDGSTFALDWSPMQRGAAFHDAGCEAVQQGVVPASNQPTFDALMRDVWLADAALVFPVLRPLYVAGARLRYPLVRAYQRRLVGH